MRSRLALPFAVILAAVLTSVPAALAGPAQGEEVAAAIVLPAEASAFTTTVPHRVLDTRIGLGTVAGPVAASGTLVLGRGALGVPADASAVAVNITLTEATGAGYATLWPRGAPRPLASNVNVGGPGDTVANGAVVPISDVGLAIYVSATTQVVLDVSGWTTLAAGPVAGGRIVSIPQGRLLDTRLEPGGDAARLDTTPRLLPVAPAGVPADAAAVIANVTVTENAEAGYVAVWAAGQPQPPTSSVNTSARGQTVANLVVAPLGPGAGLLLAASSPTHVLVDVVGYVTGPSAPADVAGLYVPTAPARVVDSRSGFLIGGARGPLPGGHRFDVAVGGRAGVPTEGVAAVLMNLTAIDSGGAGFLATYPAGRMWPGTSSLNLDQPRQTRANLVLAGLGHAGRTSLYGSTWLDVAADVAGYVIGEPAPGEAGEPAEPPPSGWWACSSGEAPAPAPPTLAVPAGATDVHVLAERPGGRLSSYLVAGSPAAARTTLQLSITNAGLVAQQRDERLFGIGAGTRVSTTLIDMITPEGPVTQVVYDSFVCGIPPATE